MSAITEIIPLRAVISRKSVRFMLVTFMVVTIIRIFPTFRDSLKNPIVALKFVMKKDTLDITGRRNQEFAEGKGIANTGSRDIPFKYIINEKNACGDNVKIINIVPIAPGSLKSRKMIRELWGNPKYQNVTGMKTMFLVGIASTPYLKRVITRESKAYHDIVQLDFVDSYMNLTYKTLSILHWAYHSCPGAEWVLKSDQDVFINPFGLKLFINRRSKGADFICSMNGNLQVCRTQENCHRKWVVPWDDYPYDDYPPYCNGPAYLIKRSMVKKLLKRANKHNPYPVEDAYYTGILPSNSSPIYRNLYTDRFPIRVRRLRETYWDGFAILLLDVERKIGHTYELWQKILEYNNFTTNGSDYLRKDLWGNRAYLNLTGMKTMFILGIPRTNYLQTVLKKEADTYHDIIQLDFIDAYMNLTLKTLSIMHWSQHYCQEADWVLKSDEDVFVNPFALKLFLQERSLGADFVCSCNANLKICRTPNDCKEKWIITLEMNPDDWYPPYCDGPGYALTRRMAGILLEGANKTLLYPMEDAYFTGMVAKKYSPIYRNLNKNKRFPDIIDKIKWLYWAGISILLLNVESRPGNVQELWQRILRYNNATFSVTKTKMLWI